ncbi:hypothetical protein ACFL54_09010 [Planctomycetota bacterium]
MKAQIKTPMIEQITRKLQQHPRYLTEPHMTIELNIQDGRLMNVKFNVKKR